MNLFNKPIEEIKKEDLMRLIENKVAENLYIEYKSELNIGTDSEKKEFLTDISSFANSQGGYIIYGILEQQGYPSELVGIKIDNIDEIKLKLENIIRDGIKARIQGIKIQEVKIDDEKWCIIIYIPKSYFSPHMISYQLKGSERFFSRNSSGKYPLDIQEIRNAFISNESLKEKINNFYMDRVIKIKNNDLVLPLFGIRKIVLHLIPFSSFNYFSKYNLELIELNMNDKNKISISNLILRPIKDSLSLKYRFNIDGLLIYNYCPGFKFNLYTQIYRNGIIETVNTFLLKENIDFTINGKNSLPLKALKEILIYIIPNFFELYKIWNTPPPFYLKLTLLNVSNFKVAKDKNKISQYEIDRDDLYLPEIIIESYEDNIENLIDKYWIELIWESAGK